MVLTLVASALSGKPKITINTVPGSAKIKIDGAVVGNSPITIELKTGKYKIEISKDDYLTEISTLEVTNKTRNKTYELKKSYLLPYIGSEYSVDCTEMESGNICNITVYQLPFEKYKNEAKDYINNSIINKTNLETVYFDMTANTGGKAG